MTLTSIELIEEEFLKDADSRAVIDWLRANAKLPDSFEIDGDEFHYLRHKYEPMWVGRQDNKLTMAVCLYGKNVKTLRQLLFNDDLPIHFKDAVIANPSLPGRWIENSDDYDWYEGNSFLSSDVVALYKNLSHNNKLFFRLFNNPGIDERFLTEVFTKQSPYDLLSDQDLLRVFQILFAKRKTYFSGRTPKYQNSAYREDARYLANAIIRFIPSIKDIGRNAKLKAFADPANLFYIRHFLEDTADLDTDGVADEEILVLFNVPEPNKTRDAEYFADELPFIQGELAKRAFSNVFFNRKEKLRKLRESSHERIKKYYYMYADISEIYSLETWQLDIFFSVSSNISGDLFNDQNDEHFESKEFRASISSMTKLLQENYKFAAALALNKQHYTRKNRRDFLRSICREADVIGNTFPWPLGNGTCVEIFEAQSKKLRDTNPEYFKDESSENVLLAQVEALSRDITQIKQQLETPHKELLSAVNELDTKIDEMKQQYKAEATKIDELQNQISAASKSILNELAQPRDILSRFLFGLPLIGRIFKALFR